MHLQRARNRQQAIRSSSGLMIYICSKMSNLAVNVECMPPRTWHWHLGVFKVAELNFGAEWSLNSGEWLPKPTNVLYFGSPHSLPKSSWVACPNPLTFSAICPKQNRPLVPRGWKRQNFPGLHTDRYKIYLNEQIMRYFLQYRSFSQRTRCKYSTYKYTVSFNNETWINLSVSL